MPSRTLERSAASTPTFLGTIMVIKDKQEAVYFMCTLIKDLEMLKRGEWIPDEDSTQASIDAADAILKYIWDKLP